MQFKSLTVAAFILGLGVVAGCDDPEVQDKVLEILEHGAVSAELDCTVDVTGYPGNGNIPNIIQYTASKNMDGSCFSQICLGAVNATLGHTYFNWTCQSAFKGRSSVQAETCKVYLQHDPNDNRHGIDKPYRPGIDGTYAFVDAGYLNVEVRDNYFTFGGSSCNGGACTDPEPWYTYDITNANCAGRNLEVFGASP